MKTFLLIYDLIVGSQCISVLNYQFTRMRYGYFTACLGCNDLIFPKTWKVTLSVWEQHKLANDETCA